MLWVGHYVLAAWLLLLLANLAPWIYHDGAAMVRVLLIAYEAQGSIMAMELLEVPIEWGRLSRPSTSSSLPHGLAQLPINVVVAGWRVGLALDGVEWSGRAGWRVGGLTNRRIDATDRRMDRLRWGGRLGQTVGDCYRLYGDRWPKRI